MTLGRVFLFALLGAAATAVVSSIVAFVRWLWRLDRRFEKLEGHVRRIARKLGLDDED